jgi:hypothetical protein
MAAPATPVGRPEGLIRLTWITDALAHVLEHAGTDEPSGTWTGHACSDYGLAIGSDVDPAVLTQICAHGPIVDLTWEPPDHIGTQHARAFTAAMTAYQSGNLQTAEQHWTSLQATWSRAWAANCAGLDQLQQVGLTVFSGVKPQRWIAASFEHHCGPHGAPAPHIHNIVLSVLIKSRFDVRS